MPVAPPPMANNIGTVSNDNHNVILGREMVVIRNMSKREAMEILSISSNSMRDVRARHTCLARKKHSGN